MRLSVRYSKAELLRGTGRDRSLDTIIAASRLPPPDAFDSRESLASRPVFVSVWRRIVPSVSSAQRKGLIPCSGPALICIGSIYLDYCGRLRIWSAVIEVAWIRSPLS